MTALLPPVSMHGREAAMGAIPALGQHTATILAELGMSESARISREAHQNAR
jgi:itaconate CoA-transferase